MQVVLTWSEMLVAGNIAIMRQVQNLREDRRDRYGVDPEDGWTPHIEGACGEMAVAKALGKFWSGALGNLKADDVERFQVRTGLKDNHSLILHNADVGRFILVVGRAPKFRIPGYIRAGDGKRADFWKDPTGKGRHAFFVPQSALRPISELTEGS